MIKNYLIAAFRNLIRNRLFSLINILGLAIGLMCSLYISEWISDELSFDHFHKNTDRIYRIYWHSDNSQTRTPHPMAQALVNDYPEIEYGVSLSPIWGPGLTIPTITVQYGDKEFDEKGFYSADSTFFNVFSFNLVKGNPATALTKPGGIIITEKIAEKYFGSDDPMDKSITLLFGEEVELKIVGVIEDITANSHFKFDFLISYVTMKYYDQSEYYTWADFGHYNYIVLKENVLAKRIEESLVQWSQKYINWSDEDMLDMKRGIRGFRLQSIQDIHLHSNLKWELEQNGDIYYVWIFSSLAVLILVIACINFMNLSSARSMKRSLEIGVRKASGAHRSQIIKQFLGESFLTVIISLLFAIVLFEILRPVFNNFTMKNITIEYTSLKFIIKILILLVTTSLLSGSYPAIFLSKFNPVEVLKGKNKVVSGTIFRRILVIGQFAISTILIVGTIVVTQQLNFLHKQKLGFDSSKILVVDLKNTNAANVESLQDELLRNPKIEAVTAVSNIPGRRFNQNPIQWPEAENDASVSELKVDYDFFRTMNLELKEGRAFSKEFPTDNGSTFILNETAARLFEWNSAIDEELIWYDDEITRKGIVVGVVEDFHFQSLHSTIEPLIIQINPDDYNYLLVRFNTLDIQELNTFIKAKIKDINPDFKYDYFFLDDDLTKLYGSEQRMKQIFGYFTVLAMFISCLGLFGLALFMTEQRTKEIGIRKVHGSSVMNIMIILSRDFSKWVLVAVFFAIPISWYVMSNWLQNFAFRMDIKWWIFIIAAVLSFLIAVITVSYQTYKAAIRNPVISLKYE